MNRSSDKRGKPTELRSLLFAPGNDVRKLTKSLETGSDAIVADLEDAVPMTAKRAARDTVRKVFTDASTDTALMVRVNEVTSDLIHEDMDLVVDLPLAAVLVPKATVAGLDRLPSCPFPIIAIIESARGLTEAVEIASAESVVSVLLGSVDLSAQLGLRPLPGSLHLLYQRATLAVASAAAGLSAPIDGPYVFFDDPEGFTADAVAARSLGFRGKVCIHPDQVSLANQAFGRGEEETWALQVVDAFAESKKAATGAIALNGEMIDAATLRAANSILGLDSNHPSQEQPVDLPQSTDNSEIFQAAHRRREE